MKKMKKLASILLAAIMVLVMAVPGMAAESSVKADDLSSHDFYAYKIFSGTANSTKQTLGDIEWADGFEVEGFVSALKDASILGTDKEGYTALEVSEALAKVTDVDQTKQLAKIVYAHKGTAKSAKLTVSVTPETNLLKVMTPLDEGYYLIVDETADGEGENFVFNQALLQVSGRGDIEIQVKTDKPSSEKKVKDINDSSETTTTDWQDSADYDIGDPVPFQLSGTLPQNFGDYESYKLVFHDTECDGLTFNSGSVKVYVNDTLVNNPSGGDALYTVDTNPEDEHTFDVVIPDAKKLLGAAAGVVIRVEYTSTLNEGAVIGLAGNENKMYMEYSNNPDVGGEGTTGTTPEDKVKVFTFKTVIDKVDDATEPKALAGAEFALEKWNKTTNAWETKEVKNYVEGVTTEFEFEGLDDGYYRLTETKTPAGYNTIDPIYFEISAVHAEKSDDPDLSKLNAEQKEATLDDDGKLTAVSNVDDGEITFKPATNLSSGAVSAKVVNKSGATLPETGGIGTTIFYVLGSILVLGAVILLVTKRRMNVEK